MAKFFSLFRQLSCQFIFRLDSVNSLDIKVLIDVISGALKSNIGHLEGGAGIAGLIKTILVLERGIIPPNANFEKLNPRIDAAALNIKVRIHTLVLERS